jgi:hypothetical protein
VNKKKSLTLAQVTHTHTHTHNYPVSCKEEFNLYPARDMMKVQNHSGSVKDHNSIFYHALLNLAGIASFDYASLQFQLTSKSKPSASFSLPRSRQGVAEVFRGGFGQSQCTLTPISSQKGSFFTETNGKLGCRGSRVLLQLHRAG